MIKRIIAICSICIMLSGCAALDALRAIGGGTSSKGHGNDNTVLVGSDQSNGVSTGGKTDVDAGDNNRDITGRDKKEVTVHQPKNVSFVESTLSPLELLLFILGWSLPPLASCFKSFGNFIIRLFTRRSKDD